MPRVKSNNKKLEAVFNAFDDEIKELWARVGRGLEVGKGLRSTEGVDGTTIEMRNLRRGPRVCPLFEPIFSVGAESYVKFVSGLINGLVPTNINQPVDIDREPDPGVIQYFIATCTIQDNAVSEWAYSVAPSAAGTDQAPTEGAPASDLKIILGIYLNGIDYMNFRKNIVVTAETVFTSATSPARAGDEPFTRHYLWSVLKED